MKQGVIRLEILHIIKESFLNYMYFSALLPHWLWLNERKDISVFWEPTSCQALCWVLYTQLIHVILTKPSETYQYENRIRLSNLPKVIPEWLHCFDEMNANPVIFLQSRCSLQSSTLSQLFSLSENWTKDSTFHQLYTIFLCSFTQKMWATDLTISWS